MEVQNIKSFEVFSTQAWYKLLVILKPKFYVSRWLLSSSMVSSSGKGGGTCELSLVLKWRMVEGRAHYSRVPKAIVGPKGWS